MKTLILVLGIIVNSYSYANNISKINALKKEAERAFLNENYEQSLSIYSTLLDSFHVDEEAIRLNLAHSYFHLKKLEESKNVYSTLSDAINKNIRSTALQQLGVISKKEKKLEESLQYLKASIKSDISNRDAQYNYEVVKKLMEDQQNQDQQNQDQQDQDQQNQDQQNQDQQNQDQQNQDQQNQDQQNQEQQDQEQQSQEQQSQEQQSQEQQDQEQQDQEQQSQEQQSQEQQDQEQQNMIKERLQEMKISEEKALMILEAMRQNEIKYLQQQKRKATKKPDRGKPDW